MRAFRATLISAIVATGCAHSMIEGTTIADTEDNRAVMQVLSEMKEAMQTRDSARLLTLVSTSYFEDMGTPNPNDDYGYEELKADRLPLSMSVTTEFYLHFDVHDIVVEGNVAHADVRYDSRARLELPAGGKWDSHREFNRVILSREVTGWRIVSGL